MNLIQYFQMPRAVVIITQNKMELIYLLLVYNYVGKEIHINLLQLTNSPLFYEAIITIYCICVCVYGYGYVYIYIGYHTCELHFSYL